MASPPFSSPWSAVTGKKRKSKGRKTAPGNKEKKRGIGVEALERLRIDQETQKKMKMKDAASIAAATELDQSGISRYPTTRFVEPAVSAPVDYNGVFSGWIKTAESAAATQLIRSGSIQYPADSVQMQQGAAGYGGAGNNGVVFTESQTPSFSMPQDGEVLGLPANIGGTWGWKGEMFVKKSAGNAGYRGGYSTEHKSGQYLGMADHPEKADRVPNFTAQFNSHVYETSEELSSMPNPQQYLPVSRCDVCLKIKRWNGTNTKIEGAFPGFHPQNNENNNGSYGGQRNISSGYSAQNHPPGFPYHNTQILNFNGSRNVPAPGLQFGSSKNLNGDEINGFNLRGLNAVFNQGTDMAASVHHQKGVTTGTQFLLEQEFFPKENITSASSKEESAFAGAVGLSETNSNPYYPSPYVDLSLKL